jgi:hypothetical protein
LVLLMWGGQTWSPAKQADYERITGHAMVTTAIFLDHIRGLLNRLEAA